MSDVAPVVAALKEMLSAEYHGWKGSLERPRETGRRRWSDVIWEAGDAESYEQYMRLVTVLANYEGRSVEETRAELEADISERADGD